MAATYVTKAELRTLLGIGSLYSDSVVEEVCQAAENIIKGYLWFNDYNIVASEITSTTSATIYTDKKHNILVGETVVVENCGAKYNGSKTVTAVTDGTNVDYATYATAFLTSGTGALAVNISGGNVALQVTPASSNSTVWTTQYRVM